MFFLNLTLCKVLRDILKTFESQSVLDKQKESTMKIFNLSYNNKELFEEVYTITGKPFGFFGSIRNGGTGSPPLSFYNAPEEVMKIVNQNVDRKYSNIEILKSGIIIRFKSRLENYGVPVNRDDILSIRFLEFAEEQNDDFDELLEIGLKGGAIFQFKVRLHEKPGLVRFFQKGIFRDKFSY